MAAFVFFESVFDFRFHFTFAHAARNGTDCGNTCPNNSPDSHPSSAHVILAILMCMYCLQIVVVFICRSNLFYCMFYLARSLSSLNSLFITCLRPPLQHHHRSLRFPLCNQDVPILHSNYHYI